MSDKFAVGNPWSAPNGWSATSGGAGGAGVPVLADNVFLDSLSPSMEMDVASTPSLGCFLMDGFTQTLDGEGTINADGPIALGGNISPFLGVAFPLIFKGTENIEVLEGTTFNPIGNSFIRIEQNGIAGVYTVKTRGLTGAVEFISSFLGTSLTASESGGTTVLWKKFTKNADCRYSYGDFAHNIGGDIIIGVNGTFAGTGKWTQTVSGSISNPTYANAFAELSRGALITSTLAGLTRVKKLSGAGTIALGAQTLLFLAGENDFYTATCDYTRTTGSVSIYGSADLSNANAMNFGIMPITAIPGSNKTLTVGGRFTCGSLLLCSSTNGMYGALVANGGLSASGAVSLGQSETTQIGSLTLAGACVLGAGLSAAAAAVHELKLGGSSTRLAGTLNGTNIACSAAGARINAQGAGRVTNCDLSASPRLVVHSAVDAAGMPLRWWNEDGNTNVRFMGRRVIGERGLRAVA